MTASSPTPWVAFRRVVRAPSLRLFCFPHAGGAAQVFQAWHRWLPADVEVCPVQLPGRWERRSEAPHRHMAPLASAAWAARR